MNYSFVRWIDILCFQKCQNLKSFYLCFYTQLRGVSILIHQDNSSRNLPVTGVNIWSDTLTNRKKTPFWKEELKIKKQMASSIKYYILKIHCELFFWLLWDILKLFLSFLVSVVKYWKVYENGRKKDVWKWKKKRTLSFITEQSDQWIDRCLTTKTASVF